MAEINFEKMAEGFIKSLREKGCFVSRWIPVSERLPENKTYVLTTIHVPGRLPHSRSGWYQDGFFHNDNGDTWNSTDREVVAWMLLPEPYEPQERSDKCSKCEYYINPDYTRCKECGAERSDKE